MSEKEAAMAGGGAPTLEELFDWLDSEDSNGSRPSGELARARSMLRDDASPWYRRTLSIGGAWLSAWFVGLILTNLFGLLGIPTEVLDHWYVWAACGVLLLAGGLRLDKREADSLFVRHVAGTVGVAGFAGCGVAFAMLAEIVFSDWLGIDPASYVGMLGVAAAGGAALVLAVRCKRRAEGADLFGQLAYASSLLGQGLAVTSGQLFYDVVWEGVPFHWPTALVVEGVVAAALYGRFDARFHRFLLGAALNVLAVGAALFPGETDRILADMISGDSLGAWREIGLAAVFAVQMAVVAATFSPSRWLSMARRRFVRPIGWACLLAVAVVASEPFLLELAGVGSLWPYRGIAAAAMVYAIYNMVDASEASDLEPAFWGALATVALAVVSTPGVMVGLLLVGFGVWRHNGKLFAFGVGTLGFHLFVFYYLMELTLYEKSLMLMTSGAVLLALRYWFVRRPWYTPGATS